MQTELPASSAARAVYQEPSDLSVEVYGFVLWIGAFLGWMCFILYAYFPLTTLHSYGITYLPSKYWALAIPAWLAVTVVFAFTFYASYNCFMTRSPSSMSNLNDSFSSSSQDSLDADRIGMNKGSSSSKPRLAALPPLHVLRAIASVPSPIFSSSSSSSSFSLPPSMIPPFFDIPVSVMNQAMFDNVTNNTKDKIDGYVNDSEVHITRVEDYNQRRRSARSTPAATQRKRSSVDQT